jgi:phosphoglucosamine mutase
MLRHDSNLGGEQSGHMIFLDYNTTGDGLVCALQVLKIMIETDSKLSDLALFVQRYPQTCINVKVASKPPLESLERVKESISDVEKTLGDFGRILVRYSGTENTCRVMVEGIKYKQVIQLANQVASLIKEEIGLQMEQNKR